MATATQQDDDIIILEETETPAAEQTETSQENAFDLFVEDKKDEAASTEVPEAPAVENVSQDIVDLGESLETSTEASDFFNVETDTSAEISENISDETVEEDSSLDMFSMDTKAEEVSTADTLLQESVAEAKQDDVSEDIFSDIGATPVTDITDDEESMNAILDATITKLEARKETIIKDKQADKAQIDQRKAEIKTLEAEITEFETAMNEMNTEQRKITSNIKSLEKMKMTAEEKA